MKDWLVDLPRLRRGCGLEALERYNRRSEPFGLMLSETALTRLLEHHGEVLGETKRVEFGEGVLGKLIDAFCDSPYITRRDYEETLMELETLFYSYKNECHELVSDDELIGALRLIYNEIARGSLEFLSGIPWKTMYRVAVTGRVAGTELEEAPLLEGEEYE